MNKKYYENRDEILARRAEYYQQNKEWIKERNKIYFKEYYQQNRQKLIKKSNDSSNILKLVDYEEYRRRQREYSKRYYDKYCRKKYIRKAEIKKVEPVLNLKFDIELSIDLTEY
jgi:hypothetical protein